MRKYRDYGMAALVFLATLVLMQAGAAFLGVMSSVFGLALDGLQGAQRVYDFIWEHQNLYSMLIYLTAGVPAALWFYFAFVEQRGMKSFWKVQTSDVSAAGTGWTVLLSYTAAHAVSAVMAWIALLLPSSMEEYTDMVEMSGFQQYSLTWFLATLILAPIVEEVVFRGLIFGYLRRAGTGFPVANLIQAVCFGLYHMNLVQGIYAFLCGLLLGYLAHRYRSLLMPVFFHCLFNLWGTVLPPLESAILPDILYGLLVLACVPCLAAVILMIHFRVGEKKGKDRRRSG